MVSAEEGAGPGSHDISMSRAFATRLIWSEAYGGGEVCAGTVTGRVEAESYKITCGAMEAVGDIVIGRIASGD